MNNMRDGSVPFSDISLKRIGIGIVFGLLAVLAAAFAFAALISAGIIGPAGATACALGAVFIGGLVASVVACGKRKMLFSAVLTALGLVLLLAVLGVLALSGVFSVKMFFLVLIIALISCILGSVIASIIK